MLLGFFMSKFFFIRHGQLSRAIVFPALFILICEMTNDEYAAFGIKKCERKTYIYN